ncbi:hypothetical protein GCM10011379_03270 [Filimonas zeae]|uniref:Uncharacterized protein n=1 Tax=Filimonas zeae TaxID=1737353 RepID=A0A917IPK1_9BACT|nr:hypothetical protein GCM10011379_03270 [Filimonas zeae]
MFMIAVDLVLNEVYKCMFVDKPGVNGLYMHMIGGLCGVNEGACIWLRVSLVLTGCIFMWLRAYLVSTG